MAFKMTLLISALLMGFLSGPKTAQALALRDPTVQQIRGIIGDDANVLILADTNHHNPGLRDTLGFKLSILKAADQRFDCLFLEEDRRMQTAIDNYFQEDQSEFKAVLNHKASLLKKEFGSLYREGTEQEMALTEVLMRKSKEAGIKIFAADLDFSSPLGKKSHQLQQLMEERPSLDLQLKGDDLILSERNRQFAQMVKKYGSRCQRSLIYIGLAHLQEKNHKPIISLSRALDEEIGVKSSLASVEQYDCDQPTKNAYKKLECLQSAELINSAYEQTGLNFLAPLQFILTGEDTNS